MKPARVVGMERLLLFGVTGASRVTRQGEGEE